MESVFLKEGAPVEAAGNKPLMLHNGGSVWMVQAGQVDIFSSKIENGEPVGIRNHVFHRGAGQVLFGVATETGGGGRGLVAVGRADTTLLRIGLDRFKDLTVDPELAEAACLLLEDWITGLSSAVRKEMVPNTSLVLEARKETSVKEGTDVRPGSEVLWVRQLEGSSCFMGRTDIAPVAEGEWIPLESGAWLRASCASRVRTLDTCGYTAEDVSWNGLQLFHGLAMECLTLNFRDYAAFERQRLDLKAKNTTDVFESALSGLTDILSLGEKRKGVGIDSSDPLLAACRLVGEKLGIEVKEPPGPAKSKREPLDLIARASRFRTRQVLLKGEWWRKDNGPLLAWMAEDKRPVALLPVSAKTYALHDPGKGISIPVNRHAAGAIAPFAATFHRPLPDRPVAGRDLLKISLFGCAGELKIVFLLAIVGSLLGLLTPIATGIIYSSVIPAANRSLLSQIAFILATLTLTTTMFEITKGIAMLRVESKMDTSLQSGVMDRLLSLPAPFFRQFTTGDLTDRTLGINQMRQALSGVATQSILSGIFSISNVLLLFWYDWRLALVAIVMVLIGAVCTGSMSYAQVRLQRKLRDIQGATSGLILQFINGIAKLRVTGTEDHAFAIWARRFAAYKAVSMKAGNIKNMLATFNAAFPTLSLMAIFACIVFVRGEKMSLGNFTSFNAAFTSFQSALLQMSMAVIGILNVIPLYERAKPILETLPEVDVTKASPGVVTGDIEISHVYFRYSEDGPYVLHDVSLSMRSGEFVAIVGSSGSGKSTLLRLLMGFETPASGVIYYDDQDISSLDIREVRSQTGVVLQNGKTMAGSIFQNIVGASSLTLEDAWEAARQAGFENDVKEMPMQMNTVLTPGAETLSGGQRQRLLVARAIVNKPRILFFDEATSALDNQTQAIVSRSLEKLQATRVVIAHRLSTIMNADRIYVLEKGHLVQHGTYEELMKQEGPFAELAKRQIA